MVTAGFRCAPDMPSSARIIAISVALVAIVFARSAIATLPLLNRSPMIPEPTTAASSTAVPRASAVIFRPNVIRTHAQEQQVGPQQLFGFDAVMNALMNLPSTSDAIASTSTP